VWSKGGGPVPERAASYAISVVLHLALVLTVQLHRASFDRATEPPVPEDRLPMSQPPQPAAAVARKSRRVDRVEVHRVEVPKSVEPPPLEPVPEPLPEPLPEPDPPELLQTPEPPELPESPEPPEPQAPPERFALLEQPEQPTEVTDAAVVAAYNQAAETQTRVVVTAAEQGRAVASLATEQSRAGNPTAANGASAPVESVEEQHEADETDESEPTEDVEPLEADSALDGIAEVDLEAQEEEEEAPEAVPAQQAVAADPGAGGTMERATDEAPQPLLIAGIAAAQRRAAVQPSDAKAEQIEPESRLPELLAALRATAQAKPKQDAGEREGQDSHDPMVLGAAPLLVTLDQSSQAASAQLALAELEQGDVVAVAARATPLGRYLHEVDTAVAAGWRVDALPVEQRVMSPGGETVVAMQIARSGRVRRVVVVRSSGDVLLDQLGRGAVPDRVLPIPRELGVASVAHTVTFRYRNGALVR
jgi:hypothetical protein